jgi:hypothetical protein
MSGQAPKRSHVPFTDHMSTDCDTPADTCNPGSTSVPCKVRAGLIDRPSTGSRVTLRVLRGALAACAVAPSYHPRTGYNQITILALASLGCLVRRNGWNGCGQNLLRV